jgi:hypothetical protein
MQGRHIDTSSHDQGLPIAVLPASPDILGSRSYNVRKEILMFFVIVGEKPADRVDSFVLEFQQGADVDIKAALSGRIVHIRYGF